MMFMHKMHFRWLVLGFLVYVESKKYQLDYKDTNHCLDKSRFRILPDVPQKSVRLESSLQSPIALDQTYSIPMPGNALPDLCYKFESNITSSGGAFEYPIPGDSTRKPFLSGGFLGPGIFYQFHDFHVHVDGSEHMVDGRKFHVEAHAVHWNTKYVSFEEAKKQVDGLVVLAFFGKISSLTTRCTGNSMWKFLIMNEVTMVTEDFLHTFIGKHVSSHHPYFYYKGSLTGYPYCESVQWIVFQQPIFCLSLRQWKKLMKLKSLNSSVKIRSSRELQSRNCREVYYVYIDPWKELWSA